MKIIILNGSPRVNGNTSKLIDSFKKGALLSGHEIYEFSVSRYHVAGCIGCEYCHNVVEGECVQKDSMQDIYPKLQEAEMIILGSPIYYYGLSGQLQSMISRIYAIGIPKNLKKAALFLSAGDPDAFEGAIYAYKRSFIEYMKLEDKGTFTVSTKLENLEDTLKKVYELGENL